MLLDHPATLLMHRYLRQSHSWDRLTLRELREEWFLKRNFSLHLSIQISTDQLIEPVTNVRKLFHNQIDPHQAHEAKEIHPKKKSPTQSSTYNRYAYIAIFLDIRMPNFRNKFLEDAKQIFYQSSKHSSSYHFRRFNWIIFWKIQTCFKKSS